MATLRNFQARSYQESISKTASVQNTLVCLPTGMGKTKIALMLAVDRLTIYPSSQVLVLSPTKPLSHQISQEFLEYTDISSVHLLTGSLAPSQRLPHYVDAVVVVATPQTIQKDLESGRLSLENFSLLVVDECHRSRQNFANTVVAQYYQKQSLHGRILALTASPGSQKEKIEEIRRHLFIDAVEIRSEHDEDIKSYIQKKDKRIITVELPSELKALQSLLQSVYAEKLEKLRDLGFSKPLRVVSKVDLLRLQKVFQSQLRGKNPSAFYGLSLVAQALKVSYALELAETQGLISLQLFLEKLKQESSKAAAVLCKDPRFHDVEKLVVSFLEKGFRHPKLDVLLSFLQYEIHKNPSAKIIVFANYRTTVTEIVDFLHLYNISSHRFVGQADRLDKGLKQAEQVKVLEDFSSGKFNVLVGSSVSEEGIDIREVDAVVFYESVGSELRSIQRSGRTGRTSAGKVVHLLTKGTRDEYLYWASLKKQQRMKKVLYDMQAQHSLGDYHG